MGDAVREILQVVDRLLQRGRALGHALLQVLVPLDATAARCRAARLRSGLERVLHLLALDGVADRAHGLPPVGLAFDQIILDALAHRFQAQRFIGLAGEHDDRQVRRLGPGLEKSFPACGVRQRQIQQQHVKLLVASGSGPPRPSIPRV